jgi:hypothetical protein
MKPQWPVTDVLIVRDGYAAWRIYFGPRSWDPPLLRRWMNARREVCCAGRPDLEDLERFMWAGDAPYEKRLTGDGGRGVELFAKGRGGFQLAFWIAEYIQPGCTFDVVIGGNVALLGG